MAADRHRAMIALGSNIRPRIHLPAAVRGLALRTRLLEASRVYETEPIGRREVPRFLNAAVLIETVLEPYALKFELLRPLEAQLGRVRTEDRDAPRTIDLDIAFFEDRVVEDPERGLVVPDPEIVDRPHLALPLADLAPDFVHPVDGRTLRELAGRWSEAEGIRVVDLPLIDR